MTCISVFVYYYRVIPAKKEQGMQATNCFLGSIPETAAAVHKIQGLQINTGDVPPEQAARLVPITMFLASPVFWFIKGVLSFGVMGLLASFIVAPICKKEDELPGGDA
jgi:hypothetical protein